MSKLFNRLARPAALALTLGLLAAPVLAQAKPAQSPLAMLSMLRPSVTGSYLAGQQALQELRTEEAARYFMQAAQADWDNPILVERAFIGFAADGQIGQAASTAKHLLDIEPTNELAELVVATEALKERRYPAAESMLANIGQDSFTAITGGILRAWALVGENKPKAAEKALDNLGQGGLEDFLLFHRALMAEAAGDTDKAIALAGQAYDAEPNVARVVEVYARILANAGQFDQAKEAIAKFEAQGLSHPVVTIVKNMVDAGQKPGVFASNVQVGAAEMFHGIGVALSRDGSMDLSIV
ncbi:MAG TPA: tetratricopeptide repeat protein, partial [Devosia sp.]|nr:tetratricopeptide repeat protein [Devosia sp.]